MTQDKRLQIDGHFRLQNTDSDMKYTYDQRGNDVIINIYGANDRPVENFKKDCNAVGVYKATTKQFEGQKWVTIKHQGSQIYKARIDFK